MPCTPDNNCVNPTSSDCVIWQGEDIACLGIVKGASLTVLEQAIVDKLCAVQEGTGIDLSGVTLCGDYITLVGTQDKTLGNLLQALFTYGCTLRELLDEVGVVNLSLDYKCLPIETEDPCGNPIELNLPYVLQVIINEFCALKTKVDTLATSITNTVTEVVVDAVEGLLETCQDNRIQSNNLTGEDKRLTFRGFVPPFCPLPYFGPLTYFDFDGKGLDDGPMCGWYLCNGKFGTPDLRGRVIVGAVQNMGGGTLASEVDPANWGGNGNYIVGDTGGQPLVKLTGNQSGSKAHSHPVNDPGHFHPIGTSYLTHHDDDNSGNPSYPIENGTGGSVYPPAKTFNTQAKTTGITLGASQAEDATEYHETRMPYKAAYFIMMIN